jgi:hypothetical protein
MDGYVVLKIRWDQATSFFAIPALGKNEVIMKS